METNREESFPQIDLVIKRKGNNVESLIQILHGVQEMLGYLPVEAQDYMPKKWTFPLPKCMALFPFIIFSNRERRRPCDHGLYGNSMLRQRRCGSDEEV